MPMKSKKSDGDKNLAQVRAILLAFPETCEVEAWGHPTFRAGKKMFAAYGQVIPWGDCLGVKVGFATQEELLKDERFFPTPYSAHQGWVSLRLDVRKSWDEVRDLARHAYKQVALKRMLKSLEIERD